MCVETHAQGFGRQASKRRRFAYGFGSQKAPGSDGSGVDLDADADVAPKLNVGCLCRCSRREGLVQKVAPEQPVPEIQIILASLLS